MYIRDAPSPYGDSSQYSLIAWLHDIIVSEHWCFAHQLLCLFEGFLLVFAACPPAIFLQQGYSTSARDGRTLTLYVISPKNYLILSCCLALQQIGCPPLSPLLAECLPC